MQAPQSDWLSYRQAMNWSRAHAVRLAEVPVEHAVSPPLPMQRLGRAQYIQVASPAVRKPGEPVRQSAPDRWWMFEARGGRLAVYALTSAIGLERPEAFGDCEIVSPAPTVAALREGRDAYAEAMEDAVVAFFAGQSASPGQGARIVALLEAITPAPLMAQHRALAPDFFAWLED
jgi:hypothetical protein